MKISEILELLGDEEVNVATLIKIDDKDAAIITKDIMEVTLHRSTKHHTTVADILKLMLDGMIIGSTEICHNDDENDTFDLFQGKTSYEELQLTSTY